jgi:hypothetical protein
MIGFRQAYKRCGISLELGERLVLGYQFHIAPSREQAIREAAPALRREHEDVRRIAPRAGLDRPARETGTLPIMRYGEGAIISDDLQYEQHVIAIFSV